MDKVDSSGRSRTPTGYPDPQTGCPHVGAGLWKPGMTAKGSKQLMNH